MNLKNSMFHTVEFNRNSFHMNSMETPFFIYSMEFHGNCIFHRIQWETFSMEFNAQYQTEFHGKSSMGLFYTGHFQCFPSRGSISVCFEWYVRSGLITVLNKVDIKKN